MQRAPENSAFEGSRKPAVWPQDGGEMGALVRAHAWSQTPLGPRENWPQSLKSAVDVALGSHFPMIVLWGPKLIQIYNDGYRELMGNKHPAGLGQPTCECWPEAWGFNEPIYERVRAGETVTLKNQLIPLARRGPLEDAWFTLCYSPLREEAGSIAGVLVTVFETTARIEATARRDQIEAALKESEERHAFLLQLSDALRPLADAVEVQSEATRLLGEHLQLDRCYFFEADAQAGDWVIRRDFRRTGQPSVAGRYAPADWPLVDEGFQRGEPMVVPDVATTPLLSGAERLAFEQLGIRAYLVIPLVKQGRFVGGIAATQAGPRNWASGAIAIAAEVAERTWAAVERARVEAALRASEEKYSTLFESIDEGFCIFEMLYDEAGEPSDYRFLEVNPAFYRHTGLPEATGKTIRGLVPAHEQYWFDIYGKVAATGESVRFEQRGEGLHRWFDVYAFRVEGPERHRVAAIFADITGRKQTERAALWLASIVSSCDDAIISKDLDGVITSWNKSAERMFGYGDKEAIGRPITALIIPADRLEEEEEILRRLTRGESIDHFETVRRRKDGSTLDVSVTISPLKRQGRVIGASKIARDISERKRAEALRELLIHELNHRVKNTLATVQSLAMQSLRNAESAEAGQAAFESRLLALSRAHDVLTRENWEYAGLKNIVAGAIAPYSAPYRASRFDVQGPGLRLQPRAGLALAMALHELATNAVKYGALSGDDGRVAIHWRPEKDGEAGRTLLRLRWTETGGPPVAPPGRRGFGSCLIEQGLAHDLGGTARLHFRSSGLLCEIAAPLDAIAAGGVGGSQPEARIGEREP
ncbi:MAG: PAS domain S-box protein [Gammaproteobacteria bacterium]|nr:PAS domain S-box protein [Gammaproteobacteria bacterium]